LKALAAAVVACFGAVLIYCTLDFPGWGDPQAPASTHVSPRYIERTIEETAVPNAVTSVLADYRGYDTMFETTVIFTAGVACIILLRTFNRSRAETRLYRHIPTGITLRFEEGARFPPESREFERIDPSWVPYDLVVKTVGRLMVPFCQIFALYVIAHGHYSPGGGFQGGVILGATVVLFAICYNLLATFRRFSEKTAVLFAAAGVFVYASTGAFCMIFGANYLDYSALSRLLPVDPVAARSLGIMMVEIGVGMSVMAVMVLLYTNLTSVGQHDEGL
jgi:multicomponent Na+:H+ antiporter subunit B